jgi:hypothetical protein
MGPQGLLQGMSPKDMMMKGGKMLAQNMIQGQPQQQMPMQAPPPPSGGGAPKVAMPAQPVRPFVTGMPGMAARRKKDIEDEMWGY